MPITVTAPAGRLTPTGEPEALPRLTDALLEAAGATGNPFLTSRVNILHAPDGSWGIGGRAYTNDDLLAAASTAVGSQ